MPDAKHTPGPWRYDPKNMGYCNGRAYYGIRSATVFEPALVPLRIGDLTTEILANARLIAAAPKLLAACKSALFTFDHMANLHDFDNPAERKELRSAIALAEGGTDDAT